MAAEYQQQINVEYEVIVKYKININPFMIGYTLVCECEPAIYHLICM